MARKRARTSIEDASAPLAAKKQVEVSDAVDEEVGKELVAEAANGRAGPQNGLEGMDDEEEDEGADGEEGGSSEEDEEGDDGDGELYGIAVVSLASAVGWHSLTDASTQRQVQI